MPDLWTIRPPHALVTGASRGIGRAIARELAATGYVLTLVGRQADELCFLAGGLGVPTEVIRADLADGDALPGIVARAEQALGRIDVLVNNAGETLVTSATGVRPETIRHLIDVDLVAPLLLARAALPGMLARGRGTIVNVASTGALAPNPGMSYYCGAKAGLAAASEALRAELRHGGVHVITVYPGPIATGMLRVALSGYPASKAVRRLPTGDPDALARRIRLAIERRRPRVIYPLVYVLFRHLPGATRWLLDRFTPAVLEAQGGSHD